MEPRISKGKGARHTVQGSRRRILTLGIAGALLIIVGAALWQFFLRPSPPPLEKADPQKMAFPLPDKPSLAVLPFTNMSDDPKQEFFSEGLAEEIINALAKLPQVFVIARNSSFAYKGKAPNLREVGRQLGAKYVLEGGVRREGDRVRITAQLIEAATGSHVFSERYDRKFADVFALQDEITLKILVALQVKLTEGERALALAKGTQNLDAYMKVMEARACANRFTPEANALARHAAEEALALDPNYPMAYLRLSATYLMEHSYGAGEPSAGTLRKAEELVQKALALDKNLAEGHAFMGRIYLTRGQHDEAVKRGEQAVALAPNSDFALAALAFTLRYCGAPQEAIGLYRKAMRLNPLPPSWYFTGLGSCYFDLARFEDAIGETKKALKDSPDNLPAHLILVAAYSMAGRSAEAQAEVAEVLRIEPKFSLDRFTRTRMYKKPSDAERFHAALRRAGIR